MNQPQQHFDMTQQEVADSLGMNRSTVNYYEKQALEKLKKALEKNGFKASDFLGVK
jgi:DNA-directed RNA polymerase specialized sigma24 family protein